MKTAILTSFLLVAPALAGPTLADTFDEDALRLRGRHLLALNVGILTDVMSNASVDLGDGVSVKSEASGFLGSLRYSHWLAEDVALDIAVGVADEDASVNVNMADVSTQAATVTRLLVGVKYQPLTMAMGSSVRPYLAGSLGSYSGSVSGVRTGVMLVEIESFTDTAAGARFGIGLDALIGSWFALGAEAGYGIVGDFDREVGGESNYSGPEFLLSLGVMLGGGYDATQP